MVGGVLISKYMDNTVSICYNYYKIIEEGNINMANKVIAGDYKGFLVSKSFGNLCIASGWNPVKLNKDNIESYEVVTDEHRKSAASGVARGLVGGALLGPVGVLAGGLSAKSKGTYQIAIQFRDGKRSLIEVDDKIYKQLIKELF